MPEYDKIRSDILIGKLQDVDGNGTKPNKFFEGDQVAILRENDILDMIMSKNLASSSGVHYLTKNTCMLFIRDIGLDASIRA